MEIICIPGEASGRIESGGRNLTPADWLQIGVRAGRGRRQVGVGAIRDCPEDSRLAAIAGILSAGADVWDFGRLTLPEFRCCVQYCSPSLALMLLPPRSARVFSPEGEIQFPLKRRSLCRRESGMQVDMRNLQKLYPIQLLKAGVWGMEGISARFSGTDAYLTCIQEQVFCQLGGQIGGDVSLRLWGDGEKVTLSRNGQVLWEGEAPDGDGPAQGLRLLSEMSGEIGYPVREPDKDPFNTALLSEKAVHIPFT